MIDYYLVFTPAKPHNYNYDRFLVSSETLHKYITEKNAFKVNLKASTLEMNKCTVKLRKYGKIDIYLK